MLPRLPLALFVRAQAVRWAPALAARWGLGLENDPAPLPSWSSFHHVTPAPAASLWPLSGAVPVPLSEPRPRVLGQTPKSFLKQRSAASRVSRISAVCKAPSECQGWPGANLSSPLGRWAQDYCPHRASGLPCAPARLILSSPPLPAPAPAPRSPQLGGGGRESPKGRGVDGARGADRSPRPRAGLPLGLRLKRDASLCPPPPHAGSSSYQRSKD